MSSPGSRALVRGRGARTRRGVRARVAGVASRDLGEQIRVQLPSYLCDCATQFISAARGCRVRLPLSRARVATRPLAFLVRRLNGRFSLLARIATGAEATRA